MRPQDAGEMVTYSNPDGGLVLDEFSFITSTDWLDDDMAPTRLRRQRWVCVEDEVGDYWPAGVMLCPTCEGEGEVVGNDGPEECLTCLGSCEHPMRGAGFVLCEDDGDVA